MQLLTYITFIVVSFFIVKEAIALNGASVTGTYNSLKTYTITTGGTLNIPSSSTTCTYSGTYTMILNY